VLPFETEKDGVEKANDGVNRLVSSVWTRDTSKATRVATELRFDRVDVNNHLPLASKMSRGDNEKSVFRKDRKPYAFDAYTQVTVSHS
jgi:aminobutyraldehyde dehydrogenase